MKEGGDFARACQKFFTSWLSDQKAASPETIRTYAQCFRLLIKFAVVELKISPEKISLSEISPEFIERFLLHLERSRGNVVRTRNARLSALKSFFSYVALNLPQYCEAAQRVEAIPSKRATKRPVPYLTREEQSALLGAIKQDTWVGRRDHAMIMCTAEAGLRNSELTGLRHSDIDLGPIPTVQCLGKGRKERTTPLTKKSARVLKAWMQEQGFSQEKWLFPNRSGGRLSADAFQYALKKYTALAAVLCRSLAAKHVTPHVLRHTAAMELFQAGVDITTIAGWLGHESLSSTGVYVEATLKMKEAALAKVSTRCGSRGKFEPDNELMSFLKGL